MKFDNNEKDIYLDEDIYLGEDIEVVYNDKKYVSSIIKGVMNTYSNTCQCDNRF